jgi:hypothetical protein
MLTLFAIPKRFAGHIEVIQLNAIRSWARLPGVSIVLLGDEDGTAEIAAELGAVHLAEVERNQLGTPYVPSCFAVASSSSNCELMAYVNADIILMSDFHRAVQRVGRVKRPFLMGGRRLNLAVNELIEFKDGWEADLRERVEREGQLDSPWAIDYFVFRRGLWSEIPPFAIGRWVWDNWLLYEALRMGATLIDATPSVQVIHPRHGYEHFGTEEGKLQEGPEARVNYSLHPDRVKWFNLNHASRLLSSTALVPAWRREYLKQRLETWLWMHPWALAFYRMLKRALRR